MILDKELCVKVTGAAIVLLRAIIDLTDFFYSLFATASPLREYLYYELAEDGEDM